MPFEQSSSRGFFTDVNNRSPAVYLSGLSSMFKLTHGNKKFPQFIFKLVELFDAPVQNL